MSIREEVAKIVAQSHPSCGLKKECNTKCGECGAERITTYLKGEVEKCGLTDEEIAIIYLPIEEYCWGDGFDVREAKEKRARRAIARAQINRVIKLLEE